MKEAHYNVIIIGAGAVGLGVALEITRRFPRQKLLVLEKEERVARHQSGHNSGVIHSGIYYKPGSLKARLCVPGAAAMVEFCREHGLPNQVCGKVIVATQPEELHRLQELKQRGEANGLTGLRLIDAGDLRDEKNVCPPKRISAGVPFGSPARSTKVAGELCSPGQPVAAVPTCSEP